MEDKMRNFTFALYPKTRDRLQKDKEAHGKEMTWERYFNMILLERIDNNGNQETK